MSILAVGCGAELIARVSAAVPATDSAEDLLIERFCAKVEGQRRFPPMNDSARSIPRHLADFEIVRRLGAGGMAEVFLAKKRGAEGTYKLLVVKRILPQHGSSRASARCSSRRRSSRRA